MLRDIRHALHTLSRSPVYALLCIAVLALGIGANAAIFSVLDSVVLHALPYPDPTASSSSGSASPPCLPDGPSHP
jgi:hypothetical protein